MNLKKSGLALSLAIITGAVTLTAQAANLNNGDILTINAGVATTASSAVTSFSGSYFAMDTNGNSKISNAEKTPLSTGIVGLKIGVTTTAGASHSGLPTAGDTNAIDAPWSFFGNTGSDFVVTAVTGSTTAGLNMSGWRVTWNGIPSIPMSTGAWATATGTGHTGATGTFTNGIGNFVWNAVCNDPYTLNYRATVPLGDPSGFGGVKYELHLEGVVHCIIDLIPPTVVSSSPVNGATGLGISGSGGLNYLVTFNEPMAPGSVTASALSVSGGVVVGAPTTSDNRSFNFPLSGLAYGMSYTVTFNAGPTDTSGNPLVIPASNTFSTAAVADVTPPNLVSHTPGTSATNVGINSSVTLTFSEAMNPATVGSAFSLTPILPAGGVVAGTVSSTDNITFVFTPSSGLANNAVYTASLAATAKDTAGNSVAAQSWNFTVGTQTQPFLGSPGGVSGNHSCGVKSDGSMACWGSGPAGQYSVPYGITFTQVSAGANHNCGLKFDGSVYCWGSNTAGQSSAPLP